MVDLECADPPVLAEFYHQVLGWEVLHGQGDYAGRSQPSAALGAELLAVAIVSGAALSSRPT